MSVEIVTKEDLQEFRQQLMNDIKEYLKLIHPPQKRWLKTQEVLELLDMSEPTLQMLRQKGTIPFKKIGGVCYYRFKDLEKLLG